MNPIDVHSYVGRPDLNHYHRKLQELIYLKILPIASVIYANYICYGILHSHAQLFETKYKNIIKDVRCNTTEKSDMFKHLDRIQNYIDNPEEKGLDFENHFIKKGDIIRLKHGSGKIRVEEVKFSRVSGPIISGRYVNSKYFVNNRHMDDFVIISQPNNNAISIEHELTNHEPQKENTMNKLFKTKDDTYGTQIATDSQGRLVLELKDGKSTIKAFDKEDLEEVRPWTFAVQFGGSNSPSKKYQFIGNKDIVKVGDALLYDSSYDSRASLCIVVEVDTNSNEATKEFKGQKIMTTKF